MAGNLDVLEQRLADLERKINNIGELDSSEGSVLDNLHVVRQKVNGLTAGKDKTQAVWKRLDELNNYLDPDLSNRLSLGSDAKADIIIAGSEQLKAQVALLQLVKELSPILDSGHIKDGPAASDRLVPLVTVQIQQEERAQELSEEARQLLESYNNIISLLSKQFVQWDAVMTKYEVAQKVRKPDDY